MTIVTVLEVLFMCIILTFLFVGLAKFYNKQVNRITSKDGIDFQGYVDINGIKQWICVRGEHRGNPIILFLHGGPGSPESAMACKKYEREIEESFIMVHWEQRGTAKSYSGEMKGKKLLFDDLVKDALSLTELLTSTYHKKKIFLIGHSFGTLIGVEAISRRPDLYRAYLGVGQIVNSIDQENISREFVIEHLKSDGNTKAIQELQAIGCAPYKNTKHDMFLERQYLKLSGGWVANNYSLGKLIQDALFCPYYSIRDYSRAYEGAMYSLDQMLNDEYWNIALDRTRTTFALPVYFISGTRDFNTPAILVRSYFASIAAPQKEMVLVEGCGHLVNFEEPRRFNAEVRRLFNERR
jgi:pimeloyl-ACP methyl ester carboxylesterase